MIHYNSEHKALYRESAIIAVAKASTLRWAVHIEGVKEDKRAEYLTEFVIKTDLVKAGMTN